MNKYNKYVAALLVISSANIAPIDIWQILQLKTANIAEIEAVSAFSDALPAQNKLVLTINKPQSSNKPKILKTWVTAYSSTPEQTDDTPFITASGSYVRNGVAAANFLPIGTRFRLPDTFGDKVFIIEDRMHPRFDDHIDIWFPSKGEAKKFGKQWSKIEIL